MAWPLIRLIPRETHFRFVKWAPVAAAVSALLIAGSCVSFFTQGLNLGIDFKGGIAMEARMPTPIPLAELRTAARAASASHDAQVQGFGSPNSAMIRFLSGSAARTPTPRPTELKRLRDWSRTSPTMTSCRPRRSSAPRSPVNCCWRGFKALGIALLLMLGYIWFRFQWQFGVGAVIAGVPRHHPDAGPAVGAADRVLDDLDRRPADGDRLLR